jgi:hypothetical protein
MMSDLCVNFPKPCDERWENMTPGERHRTCARCDRVVHDLSQYDVAGIEKLLRDEPGSCVRASIDVSGAIDTRPDSHGRVRLMVAAIGVSAGLLMSPPALARDQRAKGAIVGTAQTFSFFETTVTATDKNGNSYRAKAKSSGRYKIKNVPPGTYLVEFSSDCGERWSVEDVVVADRAVDVTGGPSDDQRCIVVGLLEISGRRGESEIG